MTVINTNVKSLISQNALNINNRALSKAMQQLSTGKRINSPPMTLPVWRFLRA